MSECNVTHFQMYSLDVVNAVEKAITYHQEQRDKEYTEKLIEVYEKILKEIEYENNKFLRRNGILKKLESISFDEFKRIDREGGDERRSLIYKFSSYSFIVDWDLGYHHIHYFYYNVLWKKTFEELNVLKNSALLCDRKGDGTLMISTNDANLIHRFT